MVAMTDGFPKFSLVREIQHFVGGGCYVCVSTCTLSITVLSLLLLSITLVSLLLAVGRYTIFWRRGIDFKFSFCYTYARLVKLYVFFFV